MPLYPSPPSCSMEVNMQQLKDRRTFLKAALAAPYVSRLARPSAAARRFDPDFAPAHEALRALREGVISSRELTEHTYRRIKKFNSKLNPFITLVEEQAMEKARQADEQQARGNLLGRLHGLPI